MWHPAGCKRHSTRLQHLRFLADLDLRAALNHEVHLLLTRMSMQPMFLPWFQTVQACKQLLPLDQGRLGHLPGRELCRRSSITDKHEVQFTLVAPASFARGFKNQEASGPAA